ncbi:MAG: N-formylglutamate amidohydrolase [Hyphomicrobiaceae bacterium]
MTSGATTQGPGELEPPFSVLVPAEQTCPFVFCSPHSGRIYPADLIAAARLDRHALRRSEDCYVDEMFAGVVGLGAPLISAHFPRAYLDVNREPYELDPALFAEPLPDYANPHSSRVSGGLGTIARVVADNEEIYRSPLPLEVGLTRIETLYKPFHRALAGLIEETQAAFGVAHLIDCHSMPSTSVGLHGGVRPDFVLGDRFGMSCDARLTRRVRDLLAGRGYEVVLNRPYAGGYITEHYGAPRHGRHALQIEINRGLYLNERTLERTEGFAPLVAALSQVLQELLGSFGESSRARLAAE